MKTIRTITTVIVVTAAVLLAGKCTLDAWVANVVRGAISGLRAEATTERSGVTEAARPEAYPESRERLSWEQSGGGGLQALHGMDEIAGEYAGSGRLGLAPDAEEYALSSDVDLEGPIRPEQWWWMEADKSSLLFRKFVFGTLICAARAERGVKTEIPAMLRSGVTEAPDVEDAQDVSYWSVDMGPTTPEQWRWIQEDRSAPEGHWTRKFAWGTVLCAARAERAAKTEIPAMPRSGASEAESVDGTAVGPNAVPPQDTALPAFVEQYLIERDRQNPNFKLFMWGTLVT